LTDWFNQSVSPVGPSN